MQRITHFVVHCLAIAALACAGSVLAQAPATKQARILVGFPPGQATDLVARMVAERLTTSMSYPVLVENQPGQGGSIVLSRLAKSTPDGATLSLSALAAYVVNPYLYKNVSYDAIKDFDPVVLVADLPMVLVVHPSVPANNLKELLDFIKANPEKLSHSSSGNGTLSHLMMEDLKMRSGVRLLHVPYQGSPRAVADLIAGTVQVGLDTVTVLAPQIKAGKLKVIAAGTKTRLPAFPDTPTIAESGYPGFEAVAWIALTAPTGTPRELRERMNADLNRALREPAFTDKLQSIGAIPRGGSTEELANHFRSEQKRWKEVVERSGAKAD